MTVPLKKLILPPIMTMQKTKASELMGVLLTAAEKTAVFEEAKREGRSASNWVRQLIRKELAARKP